MEILPSISSRLHSAMKNKGISQAALARTINMKPAALQYLLKNQAQSSRFTFKLARALKINPEWLATGNGPIAVEDDAIYKSLAQYTSIPILNIEDVWKWKELDNKKQHNNNVIMVEKAYGDNAFAVKIADSAMRPTFNKGNIVIINPDRGAVNNDLVIGMIASQNEIMFRKLSLGNKASLIPYNLDFYKSISLTTGDKILGVAIEVRITL